MERNLSYTKCELLKHFQLDDEAAVEECLKERKWWCFLLSSILTFLMGVSGVFVMRVLKFIFCREVRSSCLLLIIVS